MNRELDAVRQEESITRERIDNLNEEIAALKNAQDRESPPTFERPSEGPGNRAPGGPVGVFSRIIKIGGRAFPIISGLTTAEGIVDSLNRSQLIAAAMQELAALEQKLEEILNKERQLKLNRSTLERALAECE